MGDKEDFNQIDNEKSGKIVESIKIDKNTNKAKIRKNKKKEVKNEIEVEEIFSLKIQALVAVVFIIGGLIFFIYFITKNPQNVSEKSSKRNNKKSKKMKRL
mmetsp:Transcript_1083/g.958  ORF Transcript_1083/g.958 Transcript_1083/m.958 type:complete len:101 (+) Transcript_1083:523-825(+)